MMKTYLVACIVVLCACLVLGKPTSTGSKVNSQDISKSINRLIEDLRLHKVAEDRDQKELIKIVLAFSGKLQELQEGIRHIDQAEGQTAQSAAKREDALKESGMTASSAGGADNAPHVVQQVVLRDPEDEKTSNKIDNLKFVKLLLAALEKMKARKGKDKKDKKSKGRPSKPTKVLEGSKGSKEISKKGSEGDFLERLDKRGQYYDAELDDGLDMFKKRNQKPVHEDVVTPQKAQTLGEKGNPEHAAEVIGEQGVQEDVIAPQTAQTLGDKGNPEHAAEVLGDGDNEEESVSEDLTKLLNLLDEKKGN